MVGMVAVAGDRGGGGDGGGGGGGDAAEGSGGWLAKGWRMLYPPP